MLTNQQAITFWEHVAARKWGRYISDIEMQTILRAHRIAGDPATALEIGCDGGRWSQLLSESGWDLICIDVDRQTLGICQKRIPRAKCVLVHPDDRILPCAAGSLQLVLCMEVNSVIESDWFVPEAHRTLKDGGVVVGVCWNRRSLRGMWVRATGLLRTDTRNRFYQVAYVRWKRKLRDVGFGV